MSRRKTRLIETPRTRCKAIREYEYACDTANTDMQCTRRARVIIDGKPLCMQHAAQPAVMKLIKLEARN